MDLNKVTLIGTVIRDPKAVPLKDEQDRVVWSLKIGELVVYVVAFGKLGEIVLHYVHAGAKLYVEGRVRVRKEVLATNIILLGHRGKREVPLTPAEST
jgi:single-stranded DNA-binding protein